MEEEKVKKAESGKEEKGNKEKETEREKIKERRRVWRFGEGCFPARRGWPFLKTFPNVR